MVRTYKKSYIIIDLTVFSITLLDNSFMHNFSTVTYTNLFTGYSGQKNNNNNNNTGNNKYKIIKMSVKSPSQMAVTTPYVAFSNDSFTSKFTALSI